MIEFANLNEIVQPSSLQNAEAVHSTMRSWKPISLLLLLLCASPAASADLGSRKLATIGKWEVWADRAQAGACFVVQVYERNAAFRVGFNDGTPNGYVFLANDSWKSLVVGNKYPIEIQFDGKPPWNGNAVAKKVGNVTFLYMDFTGQNLINELSHADNVSVRYEGAPIANVRVADAGAAVEEMLRCHASAVPNSGAVSASPTDPFSQQRVSPKTDPFAR